MLPGIVCQAAPEQISMMLLDMTVKQPILHAQARAIVNKAALQARQTFFSLYMLKVPSCRTGHRTRTNSKQSCLGVESQWCSTNCQDTQPGFDYFSYSSSYIKMVSAPPQMSRHPSCNCLQVQPANSDSNSYFPSVYLHTLVMHVPLARPKPFHSD